MAFDQYQLCPCGSGKKIKFCCSKDITSELDKIVRALEGEQRVAALDQIDRLIDQKGPRTSLLAIKADVQIALGQLEPAAQTVAQFQKAAPYNSAPLALSAILAAAEEDTEAAVEKLQQALEYVDGSVPSSVYRAIHFVAEALIAEGDVLAARGHWLMQIGMSGGKDQEAIELLMRLNTAPEIPILLREDQFYEECPEGVAWAGEFKAAMKSVRRGAWLAACESLSSLAEKVPNEPAILKNIAILRGWLGQTEQAIATWRKYAALDGLSLDDAVEAEALAQLLDPVTTADEVAELTITYPVHDTQSLMEHLLSDKRISQMPVDLQQLAEEDQPPPKAAFWLLDRPAVDSAPDIELPDIPVVLGEVLLYGKQTDREARLEFLISERDAEARKAILAEVLGQFAGPGHQEKTGVVGAIADALTWRWRLPRDVSPRRRQELLDQQQRKTMLEQWPETPLRVLGGQKPKEAAADPAGRVPLLAAILLLELASETNQRGFDFNQLRRQLDLPQRQPPQLDGPDQVMKIPVLRLPLFEPETLSDENLFRAFQRSALRNYAPGIQRLGPELLKRNQLEGQIPKQDVYQALVASCDDSEQALQYVDQARQDASSRRQSPASWLLTELSIRLARAEPDHCNRLVQQIRAEHLNEPGVAEALYRLLVSHGVITPEGQPAGPQPRQAAPAGPAAAAGEPAAPAGRIWTPDGQAAEGGQKQSKLWVPGMD